MRFADFKKITRSKTLPLPLSATHEVFEVVKALFLALKLDRARVRLVGVSLDGFEDGVDGTEQLILGEREKGWRQATAAIDRASARFGQGSVRPARLFDQDS